MARLRNFSLSSYNLQRKIDRQIDAARIISFSLRKAYRFSILPTLSSLALSSLALLAFFCSICESPLQEAYALDAGSETDVSPPENLAPIATQLPTPGISNPSPDVPVATRRIIEAIFVVEALPNETNEAAESRIQPAIAVANLYLEPIGFILRSKRVVLTAELPGITLMEVVKNLHNEWRNNPEERNIVIGIVPSLRADAKMGIAIPFTACQTSNAISAFVAMSNSAEQINRTGQTLAHEIGHFLGAGHDARSVVENNLFSIMHPLALATIGGFSDLSKAEIESYAGESQEGGRCFPTEVIPSSSLHIDGPETLQVKEGESVVQSYSISGSDDPVVLRASGLPYGMSFDVLKQELRFSPDFATASSKTSEPNHYDIQLGAEQFSVKAEKTIRVYVQNVLRPPVFSDGNSTTLSVGKNKKVNYSFVVSSPDGTVPSTICSIAQKSLKVKMSGNVVQISGKLKTTQAMSCSSSNSEGVSTKVIYFLRALKKS